jgi:hypothetical protein
MIRYWCAKRCGSISPLFWLQLSLPMLRTNFMMDATCETSHSHYDFNICCISRSLSFICVIFNTTTYRAKKTKFKCGVCNPPPSLSLSPASVCWKGSWLSLAWVLLLRTKPNHYESRKKMWSSSTRISWAMWEALCRMRDCHLRCLPPPPRTVLYMLFVICLPYYYLSFWNMLCDHMCAWYVVCVSTTNNKHIIIIIIKSMNI